MDNENKDKTVSSPESTGTSSPPASAGKSPVKSPKGSPLPPVTQGLQVSKRRRLEPTSSPESGEITPHKSRSFTTPTRLATTSGSRQRTPSLQDRPIPVLSPPESLSSSLANSPQSSSSSASSSASSATRTGSRLRHVSSPLDSKSDLKRQNAQLDREIRNWKRLVDIAERAGKYETTNEAAKLETLIEGWRSAAQGAANYLLNEAKTKIEAMGGMEAYRQKLAQDALYNQSEFDDDVDVDELSEEQREEYDRLKEEYKELQSKKELEEKQEETDDSNEFTMQHLMKTLGINYNLLFPN